VDADVGTRRQDLADDDGLVAVGPRAVARRGEDDAGLIVVAGDGDLRHTAVAAAVDGRGGDDVRAEVERDRRAVAAVGGLHRVDAVDVDRNDVGGGGGDGDGGRGGRDDGAVGRGGDADVGHGLVDREPDGGG